MSNFKTQNHNSKLKTVLILFFCAVNYLFTDPVSAQVRVAAFVPSKVDVNNSEIGIENGDLAVVLKDKNGELLSGKVVEAKGKEMRTDDNGKAKINQKSKIKNQNDISKCKINIFQIIADRMNNLGEYGYCESGSWINRVFKKAQAQEKGLTLTPATVSLKLPAGEVTTQTIKVINTIGKDGSFEVYLSDYQAIDKEGTAFEFLPAGSAEDSLKNIIEISPIRFDLKNGEEKEINLRIAPPEAQKEGKYKGAIFVGSIADDNGIGTRLVLSQKVGTLVGVEVNSSSKRTSDALVNSLPEIINIYWKFIAGGIIILGVLLRVFGIVKRKKIKS